MVLVKNIAALLEDFAPLSLQESYDNAGLVCGNPEAEVSSALLTLDITESVLDEAIREGHNLIISHHPLIFQGIKKLLPDNTVNRCLIKAIRHNLNIYSAHTNIDSVLQGVSGRMADKLGLTGQKILQPTGRLFSLTFYTPEAEAANVRQAVLECGAGNIGNYSHCSFNSRGEGTFHAHTGAHPFVGEIGKIHTETEIKTEITVPEHLLNRSIQALKTAHPYEEPVWNAVCIDNVNPVTGLGIIGELPEPTESRHFLQHVKDTFHCEVIRHTPICKPTIKRVAVCGGAGASLTHTAIAQKADLYITGDYKYHDFFQAENKLIIADIGHYESEQYTKEIFYELVTKKIPNFAVQFSKVITNPVSYL
ncbi:MAG: Nif3-like dinuclear metal center hexameric protein [Odoribacter sp.]|nr:Nif3-like dinuclear metal center hexameric protein [Odoribacter sp.]